jgi:predicted dinucleotide-binding enzyme
MTRIAVIGAGNIGGTLGRAWERAGHRVAYAASTPKPPEIVAVGEALDNAEVAVLALPGTAVDALLSEHADALAGKLVIDATNRMGEERLDNTEALARVDGARVARAFNTIGWERLAEPGDATMFWCGPDGEDGALVEQLITAVGLRAVRVGGLDAVEVVNGVGRLWLTLVFQEGWPRTTAFKLVGA